MKIRIRTRKKNKSAIFVSISGSVPSKSTLLQVMTKQLCFLPVCFFLSPGQASTDYPLASLVDISVHSKITMNFYVPSKQ